MIVSQKPTYFIFFDQFGIEGFI